MLEPFDTHHALRDSRGTMATVVLAEFGTCLWSPTRNRVGHDSYAVMKSRPPEIAYSISTTTSGQMAIPRLGCVVLQW